MRLLGESVQEILDSRVHRACVPEGIAPAELARCCRTHSVKTQARWVDPGSGRSGQLGLHPRDSLSKQLGCQITHRATAADAELLQLVHHWLGQLQIRRWGKRVRSSRQASPVSVLMPRECCRSGADLLPPAPRRRLSTRPDRPRTTPAKHATQRNVKTPEKRGVSARAN